MRDKESPMSLWALWFLSRLKRRMRDKFSMPESRRPLSLEFLNQAKSEGASLVAFPEFLMAFSPSNQSAEELCEVAETATGPFTSALRESAKRARINVLA